MSEKFNLKKSSKSMKTTFLSEDIEAVDNDSLSYKKDILEELGYNTDCVNFTKKCIKNNISKISSVNNEEYQLTKKTNWYEGFLENIWEKIEL